MAWDNKVPFSAKGSLLEYPGWPPGGGKIDWRDNYETHLRLKFDHVERGRSAARAVFKDEAGRSFPMFLSDLAELIPGGIEPGGVVEGVWTFAKRGQNYGIRLVSRVGAKEPPWPVAPLHPMTCGLGGNCRAPTAYVHESGDVVQDECPCGRSREDNVRDPMGVPQEGVDHHG